MGGRSSASGGGGGSGQVRPGRGQLPRTNDQDAFRQMVADTGYTDAEARIAWNAQMSYYGNDYPEFTAGYKPAETQIITDALLRMPYYNGGTIYRGISLSDDVAQRVFLDPWKPGTVQSFTDTQGNGNYILQSFSSERSASDDFSGWNYVDRGQTAICFICDGNRTAPGVQHISYYGESEAEVLSPAGQRFYVTQVVRAADSSNGGKRYEIHLTDRGMQK